MNRQIVTLQVVEESHLQEFIAAMTATWSHAWLRLTSSGEIVLVEVYQGGSWCFASSDVVDQALFNGVQALTPEYYSGRTFDLYQASVLAPLCRIRPATDTSLSSVAMISERAAVHMS